MKFQLASIDFTITRRPREHLPGRLQGSLRKNTASRDIRKTESVNILANGPSLNRVSVAELTSSEVIPMNHFYRHPMIKSFDIVAYCMGENGSLMRERPLSTGIWDLIERIRDTPSRSYWFSTDIADIVDNQPDVFFYYQSKLENPFFDSIDLAMPSPKYYTTAQMAIFIALYLGYKEIKLYGFDHDMLANRACSLNHFYDTNLRSGPSNRPNDYHSEIVSCEKIWRTYKKIRKLANSMGVNIVNKSPGSYLDVFPSG